MRAADGLPPGVSLEDAREEASEVIFAVVEEALAKAGLRAQQVDVLVVNCSLFNPTPSLAASVMNRFRMRTDVASYNLAGMGCSASVISVGLVEKLLQVHPESTALV